MTKALIVLAYIIVIGGLSVITLSLIAYLAVL